MISQGIHTTQGKRRHREVIDAGTELFHRDGYARSSMEAIADLVGIQKCSLYNYIDSKEDLLDTIISETHVESLSILRLVHEAEGTPIQKVRAYVVLSTLAGVERIAQSAVFLDEYKELGEARRAAAIRKRDVYDEFLRVLIRSGQADETIRADIDARLLTIMINTLISSIHQWFSITGEHGADRLAAAQADLIVAAIRNPGV